MRTENDFPYMSSFGIILMILGSFVTASGITDNNFPYTTLGLVFAGFAIYLWIESACVRIIGNTTDEAQEDAKE